MLSDKTAVVTGASRGLGRAVSRVLAREGCRLGLIARDASALSALAAELDGTEVHAVPADLARREDIDGAVRRVAESLGCPEILVNNAGLGQYRPFLENTADDDDRIMDVNFRAAVHLTRGFLPGMLERGSGHIVNIASDLSFTPLANMAVYAASKFALRGFSLSLAREVKDRGVRVSLVNPGIIDTAFNDGEEGRQGAEAALQPGQLAEAVLQVLTQPGFQMVDEITLHAVHQDY